MAVGPGANPPRPHRSPRLHERASAKFSVLVICRVNFHAHAFPCREQPGISDSSVHQVRFNPQLVRRFTCYIIVVIAYKQGMAAHGITVLVLKIHELVSQNLQSGVPLSSKNLGSKTRLSYCL